MKSYGTVVIQDSVYVPPEPPNGRERRGMARYSEEILGAIVPTQKPASSDLKTFVVDLFYSDYKYIYREGERALPTALPVEYDKTIRRISSAKNVLNEVANVVATYSDCDEARKLRKRMIAISKLRNSISNEKFRFVVNQ